MLLETPPPRNCSPYEASELCARAGGHLVSFNTQRELRDVLGVLWAAGVFPFHVGLRSAYTGLPIM